MNDPAHTQRLWSGNGPRPDGAPPELVATIEAALRDFNHCPRFYADDLDPEPCDGMEGCNECLRNAALSVAQALSWRLPEPGRTAE